MGEYDEIVTAEGLAEQTEKQRLAGVRSQGLEAAKLRGRLYGEDTARQLRETGQEREARIQRAVAYAVWEYNGKLSAGPCSRVSRHHVNHSGAPCPECGYPTA